MSDQNTVNEKLREARSLLADLTGTRAEPERRAACLTSLQAAEQPT